MEKEKKPSKKVIEIKSKSIEPQEIYTKQKDKEKLSHFVKILDYNKIQAVGISKILSDEFTESWICIKPQNEELLKPQSASIFNNRPMPKKTFIPLVYAIDYLSEPSYANHPRIEEKWICEIYKSLQYKLKKKFWESLGVKYIVDYNIDSIIKEILKDR